MLGFDKANCQKFYINIEKKKLLFRFRFDLKLNFMSSVLKF